MSFQGTTNFLLVSCFFFTFQLSVYFVSPSQTDLSQSVMQTRMQNVKENLRAAVRELYAKAEKSKNEARNESLSFQQDSQKQRDSSNDDECDEDSFTCPKVQNSCIDFDEWTNLKNVHKIKGLESTAVMLHVTCDNNKIKLNSFFQALSFSGKELKKVVCINHKEFDEKAIAVNGLLDISGQAAQAVSADTKGFTIFIKIVEFGYVIAEECIQCSCNNHESLCTDLDPSTEPCADLGAYI